MKNNISILEILHDTTVDGPGFRTSIYAAGCKHKCVECHNPESWNIDNGKMFSVDKILQDVKCAEFANVTFTGGDPLLQVVPFTELATRIKKETSKNIWCYTGYMYENIVASANLSQILPFIDVLVDGLFVNSLRDESLLFRGSRNQRIIDVAQSLKQDSVVLWNTDF